MQEQIAGGQQETPPCLEPLPAGRSDDRLAAPGTVRLSQGRRELAGGPDQVIDQREQILFIALAMDGLLNAHPDPQLRPTMVRLWRERLAEEGRSDAA